MSSEYPLSPFADFAMQVENLDFELEVEQQGGWGLMKPERRDGPVPSSGNYEGMGVFEGMGDGTP